MADQQGICEHQGYDQSDVQENSQCVSNFLPDLRRFCLSRDNALELYRPQCPVCHSPMVFYHAEADSSSADKCLGMSVTPCGHVIGEKCLKAWHESVNPEYLDCPVCREWLIHEECGHPVDILKFEHRDDADFPCIPQIKIAPLCNACRLFSILIARYGLIKEVRTLPVDRLSSVHIHVQLWNRRDEYARIWDSIKLKGFIDKSASNTVFDRFTLTESIEECLEIFRSDTHRRWWQPDMLRFHIAEVEIGPADEKRKDKL